MFGFSLTKLLVTVAIVAAVWYGFKFIGRLDKAHKAKAALKPEGGDQRRPAAVESEEMERCAACGTYVAVRGAASCGRDDCPYPG